MAGWFLVSPLPTYRPPLEVAGGGGCVSEAPTGLAAAGHNANADVSWVAPVCTGGQSITDYAVQYSADSGASWATYGHSASTSLSINVEDLTNGTDYVFQVAAITSSGTGAWSAASGSVTPGAPHDPDFASVSLLLRMDGTAASFIDSSSSPTTVTATGNATQSATRSRWGGKSAYFDGTSSAGAVVSAASSAFDFGAGDFSIEAWVYFDSVSGGHRVAGGDNLDGGNKSWVWYVSDGTLSFYLSTWGGSWNMGAGTFGSVAAGQWYHVAMVRQGSTVTPYLNGSAGAGWSVGGQAMFYNTINGPSIGGLDFNGYIDDFRVTKGVARTITVPTAAFPNA